MVFVKRSFQGCLLAVSGIDSNSVESQFSSWSGYPLDWEWRLCIHMHVSIRRPRNIAQYSRHPNMSKTPQYCSISQDHHLFQPTSSAPNMDESFVLTSLPTSFLGLPRTILNVLYPGSRHHSPSGLFFHAGFSMLRTSAQSYIASRRYTFCEDDGER